MTTYNTLLFSNNARSVLTEPLGATATTVNITQGTGVNFPSITTAGQYFVATLNDAATGLLSEIVWVIATPAADTFTILRAQEGTVALNWNIGDTISNLWTAGSAAALTGAVTNVASTADNSTALRPISTRFAQIANIQDFMANANGSAVPVSTALANAYNSLASTGGTISFPNNGVAYPFATTPAALTGKAGTVTLQAQARAVLTFAAGLSGITLSAGASILPALNVYGLTFDSLSTTVPAGAGLTLESPDFVSGALTNNSKIQDVRITGGWLTGLAIVGLPQLAIRDVEIDFPNNNTTSTGVSIIGNGSTGISTYYVLDNVNVSNSGATAFSIGDNVQGVIMEACGCAGQNTGLAWANTAGADYLTINNCNFAANQCLNLTGSSVVNLFNVQMTGSYFYQNASTSELIANFEYVTNLTITGCQFDPISGTSGGINIVFCNNVLFGGGCLLGGGTLNLAGSQRVVFSDSFCSFSLIEGAADNTLYNNVTFFAAVNFTGTTDTPQFVGCTFLAAPTFSTTNAPFLANNYFEGVFYALGAPASCFPSNLQTNQVTPANISFEGSFYQLSDLVGNTPNMPSLGFAVGCNYTSTGGEVDFFNNAVGLGGGFNFYVYNPNTVVTTLVLSISGAGGNSSLTGAFYASQGLGAGAVGSPTITSGAGVPTTNQPKGSLYQRTNGGVGSTLYVTQGGAIWNAVPGV